jgi:hypothetical protein
MSTFDSVRQTFPQVGGAPLVEHVPEHLARAYAVQSREFAARDLAREGYSSQAIATALGVDVKLVYQIIGVDL